MSKRIFICDMKPTDQQCYGCEENPYCRRTTDPYHAIAEEPFSFFNFGTFPFEQYWIGEEVLDHDERR